MGVVVLIAKQPTLPVKYISEMKCCQTTQWKWVFAGFWFHVGNTVFLHLNHRNVTHFIFWKRQGTRWQQQDELQFQSSHVPDKSLRAQTSPTAKPTSDWNLVQRHFDPFIPFIPFIPANMKYGQSWKNQVMSQSQRFCFWLADGAFQQTTSLVWDSTVKILEASEDKM